MLEIPTEGDLTPDDPRSPERDSRFQKRRHLPEVAQGPILAPLKISAKDIENAKLGRRIPRSTDVGALSDEEDEEEEESSADFYVDALTTMGSDPDSEPGSRGRWDIDSAQSRFAQDSDQVASLNHFVLKAHVEAHRLTPPGGSEDDHEEELARRLGLQEHESSVAAIEWELEAGEALVEDAEPRSVDESVAVESVATVGDHAVVPEGVHEEEFIQATTAKKLPEKVPHKLPDKVSGKVSDKAPKVSFMVSDKVPEKRSLQSHESVSLLDSYRAPARVTEQRGQSSPVLENDKPPEAEKDNQVALGNVSVKQTVEQTVEQNVEQTVSTPKSRRLWAKDNGAQVTSSILSVKLNGGSEFNNILRARMLESSEHSHEDSTAVVPDDGEDSRLEKPGTQSSSSNTSSPYTNISSSDVAEEDGYTSSARSSPKGANFGALLSPSESPPRIGRGLMGPPTNYDANPPFTKRSHNLVPPITPFLSSSPSVSRCPSINDQPSVSSVGAVGHSSRLPPQLMPSPRRDFSLRHLSPSIGPLASSADDSDKVLYTQPSCTAIGLANVSDCFDSFRIIYKVASCEGWILVKT